MRQRSTASSFSESDNIDTSLNVKSFATFRQRAHILVTSRPVSMSVSVFLCLGFIGVILYTSVSFQNRQFSNHSTILPISSLRSRVIDDNVQQCRYFLAESAIPDGGLGLFTTIPIRKGEMAQPTHDLCIYVAETPEDTDFRTHSWSRDTFLGNFEGSKPRAACEGFGTQINSMPPGVLTSKLILDRLPSNAGLTRDRHPGAGAISHHFGLWSQAQRDIEPGSELTIDYGDFPYDSEEIYVAPVRSVEWIQRHGRCVDNILVQQATDPEMGRGAFAMRAMKRGTIVTAAPLQTFSRRNKFHDDEPEAQFVNYCFQPRGTKMMLYPYGIGVNMINHSKQPNVAIRWADWNMNHHQWLDIPLEEFWEHVYPGAMIFEYIALRDIKEGEELFIDYGPEWEHAWKAHVANWKPVPGAAMHVYPQDMDPNEHIRTIEEQKMDPYPSNLGTICYGENDDDPRWRGRPTQWKPYEWDWPEGVVWCHITRRYESKSKGKILYEAVLDFERLEPFYNASTPRPELYITFDIPRSAISFVEKPYQSDLHLPNAFRQTMALPDDMTPSQWQSVS